MKSKKKVLVTLLCAALLVFASVMGTMAYLTSQDEVVNTFTVGKVAITLDETDVDINGVQDGEDRVKANDYKLMPGHEYIKDPAIHVDPASEIAWIFVKVENDIAGIEAPDSTIAKQMADYGWTLVAGETNVYCYQDTVKGGEDVPVFSFFKINSDVEDEVLNTYEKDKKIVVTGYAVQADGFDTAAEAWDATFGN